MTIGKGSSAKRVLLVEDNPGDIRLLQEVFRECGLSGCLDVVQSGSEALDYLLMRGEYGDAPVPDIILLDLNMPGIDGFQTLERIKEYDKLRRIPVIVLSSSSAETDIERAYNLNANCYLTKPHDLEGSIRLIKSIEGFWLNTVKLTEGY